MKATKSSFGKQMDHVGESVEFLFGTRGSRESFEEDLATFTDQENLDELYSSMEFFFWTPDARKSMADTLGDFSEPEPGALRETFELWGW